MINPAEVRVQHLLTPRFLLRFPHEDRVSAEMEVATRTCTAYAYKRAMLVVGVLLVMLVMGGIGISRSTQPSRFPLTPGTEAIVFVSGRDRAINLYAIRPDGTHETRLTDFRLRSSRWWFPSFLIPYGDATTNGRPQPAPDGQGIIFTSNFEGPRELLYQMQLDGSGLRPLDLPTVYDAEIAVSPDGQWIAFLDAERKLTVMRHDGAVERCLMCDQLGEAYLPTWSPDSQQLVFPVREAYQPNVNLYGVNLDGTNFHRLTTTPDASDDAPDWSPDGRQIAFASNRGGGRTHVYVMKTDGTEQRLLTTTAYGGEPVWSPDGRRIAFRGGRDGEDEIYVMSADGSNPTRLTFNTSFDSDPVWVRIPDNP